MITVSVKKEVHEDVSVKPGYYKDYGFFYYLNEEGDLISVSNFHARVTRKEDEHHAKLTAELNNYKPATKEEFYKAYEAFRQTRSSILSK